MENTLEQTAEEQIETLRVETNYQNAKQYLFECYLECHDMEKLREASRVFIDASNKYFQVRSR